MSNGQIFMVSRIHQTKIEPLEKNHQVLFHTSKTSTLLMTCDARNPCRNWILFLIEFVSICLKMGRSRFSSLNDFRLIFWLLFYTFFLSLWLLGRLAVLLQIASSPSSAILAYLSFFQNFLIGSKKFIAKRRESDSFKGASTIRFRHA